MLRGVADVRAVVTGRKNFCIIYFLTRDNYARAMEYYRAAWPNVIVHSLDPVCSTHVSEGYMSLVRRVIIDLQQVADKDDQFVNDYDEGLVPKPTLCITIIVSISLYMLF